MKMRVKWIFSWFLASIKQAKAFQPVPFPLYTTVKNKLSLRVQRESSTVVPQSSLEITRTIYLRTSKSWEKRFEELIFFLQENGHCNVPRNYGSLGNWVQKQRLSYKVYLANKSRNGNITKVGYNSPPPPLSKEQVELLDSVGFIWDVHDYKYQCNLNALKEFHSKHFHIDVPSSLDGDFRPLYKWLCRQKEEYKKYLHGKASKLTSDRREALEKLGFHVGMFDILDSVSPRSEPKRINWEGRYQQLLQFKKIHGHCVVPSTKEEYAKLSSWVQHQRCEKKKKLKGLKSRLTDEKEKLLEDAGFVWSTNEWNWNLRLSKLKEYRKIHGHCNVSTKDGELGGWVTTQRMQYGKKKLSSERIDALNGLGFIWDMHELVWDEKYHELKKLLENNNLDQAPASLNAWIATQRSEKRYKDLQLQNHLSDERERKLNGIGFEWNAFEQRCEKRQVTWRRNFHRLKEHMEKTGSSRIRIVSGDSFGIWVRDQRRYLKAHESGEESPMTTERRDLLTSIGFQ